MQRALAAMHLPKGSRGHLYSSVVIIFQDWLELWGRMALVAWRVILEQMECLEREVKRDGEVWMESWARKGHKDKM